MNLTDALAEIGKLAGKGLREAICQVLGYYQADFDGVVTWMTPDHQPVLGEMPHYESEHGLAVQLMEANGLSLFPAYNDEEKRYRWFCSDIQAVKEGQEIHLENRDAPAYASFDLCEAVGRTFVAMALLDDLEVEASDDQDKRNG